MTAATTDGASKAAPFITKPELKRLGLSSAHSISGPLSRARLACWDSAPRYLSGFLPGYAECGASRFCRGVGGRSSTRAVAKSWATIMRPRGLYTGQRQQAILGLR